MIDNIAAFKDTKITCSSCLEAKTKTVYDDKTLNLFDI